MSTAVTQQVVEGYLQELAGHWLAVDVRLDDVAAGRTENGRGPASALLRTVVTGLGTPHVVVADDRATIEWIGPTPTVATLQVTEGEVAWVRLYRAASSG